MVVAVVPVAVVPVAVPVVVPAAVVVAVVVVVLLVLSWWDERRLPDEPIGPSTTLSTPLGATPRD